MRTLTLTLVLLAATAGAQAPLSEAEALHARAAKAFDAAVGAGDRDAQDAAAVDLRRALELFSAHLDQHPEDQAKCEESLAEINATLFWHRRMMPLDLGEEPGDGAVIDEAALAAARAQQREEQALALLETACAFAAANPDDLYGQRVELREVTIQFPDTPAATQAEERIALLDEQIAAAEAEAAEKAMQAAATASAPAEPESAVTPLLVEMQRNLDAMAGSDVEKGLRARIAVLLDKRRFVEAYELCRDTLERSVGAEQAHIDEVLAGLARAVTILDHVVAAVAEHAGDSLTLDLIGGAKFTGRVEKQTWNAIVLTGEQTTLHVPYFRLNDSNLVRLAQERDDTPSALAAAAFLALSGDGARALLHLERAVKGGAASEEVEVLRRLAADEKAKSDLAAEIKKEQKRWGEVDDLPEKLAKAYKKRDYEDILRALLKADKRASLTARDLSWLSEESHARLKMVLGELIRQARESCRQTHIDETRVMRCHHCKGEGTILTKSPGGLFGVKKKTPVRVQCPTCDGRRQVRCPECYERFHDQDARQLQARAGGAGGSSPR